MTGSFCRGNGGLELGDGLTTAVRLGLVKLHVDLGVDPGHGSFVGMLDQRPARCQGRGFFFGFRFGFVRVFCLCGSLVLILVSVVSGLCAKIALGIVQLVEPGQTVVVCFDLGLGHAFGRNIGRFGDVSRPAVVILKVVLDLQLFFDLDLDLKVDLILDSGKLCQQLGFCFGRQVRGGQSKRCFTAVVFVSAIKPGKVRKVLVRWLLF